MKTQRESLTALTALASSIGYPAELVDPMQAKGKFHGVFHEAIPGNVREYMNLLELLDNFAPKGTVEDAVAEYKDLMARLDRTRRVIREVDWHNTVMTIGKNYLLDNGMAGASYTAAFYMGLVSSVSYTAISAADTAASHAGWTEGGNANAPTYSGARKTTAWSAASAGAKALSAALVFTFTGSGTVKGCFLSTASTVDATSGTLFSAGLFSGGDQPVVSTNTLSVSYSLSI
jgi:hypothetical protein